MGSPTTPLYTSPPKVPPELSLLRANKGSLRENLGGGSIEAGSWGTHKHRTPFSGLFGALGQRGPAFQQAFTWTWVMGPANVQPPLSAWRLGLANQSFHIV